MGASTAMADVSDADLIRAARGGDRDAFGQIYRRYGREVARFIRFKLGAEADRFLVDDLTSETFLVVLRSLDSGARVFDSDTGLLGWLRWHARNRIRDRREALSRLRRRPETLVADYAERAASAQPHDADRYETGAYGGYSAETLVLAGIDQEAIADAVHTGLATLAPGPRRSVQLCDLENRGRAETAQAMNRKPVTIDMLRRKAKQQLAAALDPHPEPGRPGRYPVVLERARTAHAHRAHRPPLPTPPGGEHAVAELARCQTKTETLHVAWRFLDVTATPGPTDAEAAINWLAAHGYQVSYALAYAECRNLAATTTDHDNNATTEPAHTGTEAVRLPPLWARRIRAMRKARGWTPAEAAERLRAHTDQQLPKRSSLAWCWRSWERGLYKPNDFYAPLIAAVFADEPHLESAA